MINTKNIRYLKRLDDGSFTLANQAQLTNPPRCICDSCGVNAKCKFRELTTRVAHGISSQVVTCKAYRPVLGFTDDKGLDQPVFNTLRLNTTWKKRINPQQTLTLYHLKRDSIIADVELIEIVTGPFDEMLEQHVDKNHLTLGGMDRDKVKTLVAKMYKNFATQDSQLSAIYMRQIPH